MNNVKIVVTEKLGELYTIIDCNGVEVGTIEYSYDRLMVDKVWCLKVAHLQTLDYLFEMLI